MAGAGFFLALLPVVLSPIPRLAELPAAAGSDAAVRQAAAPAPERARPVAER